MSQVLENAIKAQQTADLLLQDLQELNKSGDMLISLLVLPEIEKIAHVKNQLSALITAIK